MFSIDVGNAAETGVKACRPTMELIIINH
jgi:hypothetical protein